MRPTHSVEKPKPGPHADGAVGSVKSPTVESLEKQIHELFVKYSTMEETKASRSPQNTNVFTQSYKKGKQQPCGKKKKGKKGEGNQNKPKSTNNAYGGKNRGRR